VLVGEWTFSGKLSDRLRVESRRPDYALESDESGHDFVRTSLQVDAGVAEQ
jgi:hypothetical protein